MSLHHQDMIKKHIAGQRVRLWCKSTKVGGVHKDHRFQSKKSQIAVLYIVLYITVLRIYGFNGKIITCLKRTCLASSSLEQEASSRAFLPLSQMKEIRPIGQILGIFMWRYLYMSYTGFFLSPQSHGTRFSDLIFSAKCLTFGPAPVFFQESKACSRLLLRIRLSSLILRNFASPWLQVTIVSELQLMIFPRIPAEGAALRCLGIAPGKCFSDCLQLP